MLNFSPKSQNSNGAPGQNAGNAVGSLTATGATGIIQQNMFIDPKKGPLNFLLMKAESSNNKNRQQEHKNSTGKSTHSNQGNFSNINNSKQKEQSSGRKSHTHTGTNQSINNTSSQNISRNPHKSSLDKGGFEDIQAENMVIYNCIEKCLRQGNKGKFMPVDNLNDILDLLITKDKPFAQSLRKFKELLEQVLQGILQEMLRMQETVLKHKKAAEESDLYKQEKHALESQIMKLKMENKAFEQMLTTASSGISKIAASEQEAVKRRQTLDKQKENNNINNNETLLKENEKLKATVIEMQNALIAMRDKENKLIKLLIGVKNKGVDLDQIFREEVLNEAGGETEKLKGELEESEDFEDDDDDRKNEIEEKKVRATLKKAVTENKEPSLSYAFADESCKNFIYLNQLIISFIFYI
jgi:hypothetical protein